MTYSTHEIEDFALPLPITQTARRFAQQFANQQSIPEKAEQVRFNTLAVCVVNDYLKMMGIATNLEASDSWSPVMRLFADVADLEILGVGRLECRPLKMNESICHIPPEVWDLRVGYAVVQIDDSFQQASLLGFTPTVTAEELPISELESPEQLIDRIHQLMQPVTAANTVAASRLSINLSQWLNNIFETGWQTVETLLNPPQLSPAFSFRSIDISEEAGAEQPEAEVRRAKLIDLGMQLAGQPVILIVELRPESEQRTNIVLQVHPTGHQAYLPPRLALIVVDESGATFLQAEARSADNYIQLQFSGELGERFSVKVALGEASVTESFVI